MTDGRSDLIGQQPQPEDVPDLDRLYGTFVRRPEYAAIEMAIDDAMRATIRGPEARGVVLTAPSGAGKTTFLERLVTRHPRFGEDAGSACRIMRMEVKSPCTLKGLGRAVSAKAGYTIRNDALGADVIWDRARSELRKAKFRLILFDEIQNMTAPARKGDDQLIRDTLKTLLTNSEWPVALILAGQPSVNSFLEADDQVQRRMAFASLAPLDASKSAPDVRAMIINMSKMVRLGCDDAEIDHLVPRLMHAGNHQFGSVIEILRAAVDAAAAEKRGDRLTREHFARLYARRTGNAAFYNPFLAQDWIGIDPRRRNVTSPGQIVGNAPPPPKPIRRRSKP